MSLLKKLSLMAFVLLVATPSFYSYAQSEEGADEEVTTPYPDSESEGDSATEGDTEEGEEE